MERKDRDKPYDSRVLAKEKVGWVKPLDIHSRNSVLVFATTAELLSSISFHPTIPARLGGRLRSGSQLGYTR